MKDDLFPKIVKYSLIGVAIIIGMFFVLAIMKILFIVAIYDFIINLVYSSLGVDIGLAKVIAVPLTAIFWLIIPGIISFFFLPKKKKNKKFLIIGTSVIFVVMLGVYFNSSGSFFNRTTGESSKYYIKTISGFKFSSQEDYDPVLCVKYKPVTAEIIKEYLAYKKTGELGEIPEVEPGKYFDMITGEPIVWYSEKSDGKIKLYSVPGFDQETGEVLKPMTTEIAKIISDGKTTIGFFEDRILGLIAKGKNEPLSKKIIEEYSKAGNSFKVKSSILSLERAGGFFDSKQAYQIYIEKVIFIPPKYTIIGICAFGVSGNRSNEGPFYCHAPIAGFLVTNDGKRYDPKMIFSDAKIEKDYDGTTINLMVGETRRMLYIFDYIPITNGSF